MGVLQAVGLLPGRWPWLGHHQRFATLSVNGLWRCGRAGAPLTLE
ncbi:MAG: hypothetical protein WBN89_14895 [Prochlorococcaceae cyanobacterium]